MIDDFVAHVFEGVGEETAGARIAQAMRELPAELPDDPSAEQVDAWTELAELVSDHAFRARARQMAAHSRIGAARAGSDQPRPIDPALVLGHAGAAVTACLAPDSAEGKAVLDLMVPAGTTAAERTRLADQIATFTDRRVERYWQLIGAINGRPPFPPSVPAFEWLIAGLRAKDS